MWSPTSPQLLISSSRPHNRDNPGDMDLTPNQIEELEAALEKLAALDPALLPEPVTELADLLSRLLDQLEGT